MHLFASSSLLRPREMCYDAAVVLFVSQFGIFMFSTQQNVNKFCIKMRLKLFFCCCIEIENCTARNRDDVALCPLCASFPYGLMNLHKFSACIIPATIASSSPRESFECCSKNGAMKREKLICRRRWGSRNFRCILSCVFAWIRFVWGWALIYFPIHFII